MTVASWPCAAALCLSLSISGNAHALAIQSGEPADLVVIGKRFEETQGVVTIDRRAGTANCKVNKTSGYPEIDSAVCQIAISCSRWAKGKRKNFWRCLNTQRSAYMKSYIASREVS